MHWVCAFVLLGAFFLRAPVLWDLDSYYHLAVARHYLESGVAAPVPWLRFSLLSSGADKEWLFHLLLMPFAALADPAIGGRVALAAINATIATVIAAIAGRALGSAALVVPLWLWIAAPPFFARMMRLRPELLALLIILCAIVAAAKGRYRILGLLAFAFASAYTAFHVFVALAIAWQVWQWFAARERNFHIIGATLAGTAAGLFLRPHPIENLKLWYVQNVEFFQHVDRLDVGAEIHPPAWPQTIIRSSVWIATLIVIALLATRKGHAVDREAKLFAFTAISAAAFLILFVRMGRMATYVYPLLTLVVVLAAWRRVRVRTAAIIFAGGAALALPLTFDRGVRDVIVHLSTAVSELDWFTFGRAVPSGAKVAATWASTEAYVFWAPQGRYLNALDPLFMARPYPRAHAAQRRLFSGLDPDVPFTLQRDLDSDYLALDWTTAPPLLVERLRGDPRLQVVYGGYNALFRVRAAPGFITAWDPAAASAGDPIAAFVDVTELAKDGCATVRHQLNADVGSSVTLAFAPWGPSALMIDGMELVREDESPLAILAREKKIEILLSAGVHTVEVRTCRDRGTAGFFLRRVR